MGLQGPAGEVQLLFPYQGAQSPITYFREALHTTFSVHTFTFSFILPLRKSYLCQIIKL